MRSQKHPKRVVWGAGILGVIGLVVALGLGSLVAAAADDPTASTNPATETTTVVESEPTEPATPPPENTAVDPAPPLDPAPPPELSPPPDPSGEATPPGVTQGPGATDAGTGSSGGAPPGPAALAAAPASPSTLATTKVSICHRTNSVTNPYRLITVDESATGGPGLGDHLTHGGGVFTTAGDYPPPHNGDQWGDIVPDTYADGTARSGPTLNWPEGSTIFGNGCTVPGAPGTGTLQVKKVVTGDPQALPTSATFTVHVTVEDGSAKPVDEDVTFTYSGGSVSPNPQTYTGLPPGATVTVTEPGNGGADKVEISGLPATIEADKTVTVTVTNTFTTIVAEDVGITVVKEVKGAAAPAEASFTVKLTCTLGSVSKVYTIEFGYSNGIVTPNSWADTVPAGSTCTATETETGGATVTYKGNGVTIPSGSAATITVTNTFDPKPPDTGVLSVAKVVRGDDEPDHGTTFTVEVVCTTDSKVTTTETLTFTYPGDLGPKNVNVTYEEGKTTYCTVDETKSGGALSITYSPASAHTTGVALSEGNDEASVTVTNRYGDEEAAVTPLPPEGVQVGGVSVTQGQLPYTGSSITDVLLRSALVLLGFGALITVPAWRQHRRRAGSLTG